MARKFKRYARVGFTADISAKGIKKGQGGDLMRPGNPCAVLLVPEFHIVELNQRETASMDLTENIVYKSYTP